MHANGKHLAFVLRFLPADSGLLTFAEEGQAASLDECIPGILGLTPGGPSNRNGAQSVNRIHNN
eukprot:2091741-Rhodomonas_salina.1